MDIEQKLRVLQYNSEMCYSFVLREKFFYLPLDSVVCCRCLFQIGQSPPPVSGGCKKSNNKKSVLPKNKVKQLANLCEVMLPDCALTLVGCWVILPSAAVSGAAHPGAELSVGQDKG